MVAALATLEDVESAWRTLAEDERGPVEHYLRMAQALVRARVPTLDKRIEVGKLDLELVRDVVVAVVRRVMTNPDNARGRSRTAGPFTEYTQWDADSVGLSLLPIEREMLAPPIRRAAGIGTIRLDAGLGWPQGPPPPLPPERRSGVRP